MRNWIATLLAGFCFMLVGGVGAGAQTFLLDAPTIALKNGETTAFGKVYWVSNCRSLLLSTPEAEAIEPPPGITVTIQGAMVLPRRQSCPNKVAGGLLVVSANNIEDYSLSRLTVRIKYHTKDGERQRSEIINLSLHP